MAINMHQRRRRTRSPTPARNPSRYYNREYEARVSPTSTPNISPLRGRPMRASVSPSARYRSDYSRSQHEELATRSDIGGSGVGGITGSMNSVPPPAAMNERRAMSTTGVDMKAGIGFKANANSVGGLNVKDLANRLNSRAGRQNSFRPAWVKKANGIKKNTDISTQLFFPQ